jgi:anaerobic selenocysteine-containing dehydrogenase
MPYGPGETWPTRVDQYLTDGLTEDDVERWVQSASILHSNGDALDIAVRDGRIVGVRGRAVDRVNHGRLDPEDLFGWQANASADRLSRPLVRRGGELVETDRDTAMDLVVGRTRALLEEQGPSAIGFYNSGQLFTEDYYTLGLIAHGGIRTPTSTATPGCARPPRPRRSRSPSPATGNRAPTPTSTPPTSSASTGTTWPRRRWSPGAASWTGWPARTHPRSSASTRG